MTHSPQPIVDGTGATKVTSEEPAGSHTGDTQENEKIDKRARSRAIVSAVLGNALEHYDTTAYAFFTVYFSQHFFPADDPVTSDIYSYFVFGSTYFVRPIGGVLLSYYADRIGRKPIVMLLLIMMALTTGLVGLLPTYKTIGAAAPTLLIVLRIIQAVSVGGLYGSITTFLMEMSPSQHRGLYTSFQMIAQGVAPVLSNLVALALLAIAGKQAVIDFWWRAPFIVGFATLPLSYYVHKRVAETPDFLRIAQERQHRHLVEQQQPQTELRDLSSGVTRRTSCSSDAAPSQLGASPKQKHVPPSANLVPEAADSVRQSSAKKDNGTVRNPAITMAKVFRQKTILRQLLCCMGIIVVGTVSFYGVTIYLPMYIQDRLDLEDIHRTALALISPSFAGLGAPWGGWLSDKFGRKRSFQVGVLLYALAFYMFFFVFTYAQTHFAVAAVGCAFIGFTMGLHWGGQPILMAESFPAAARATAITIPYNVTVVLFGALTPTYLKLFDKWFGVSPYNVAGYIGFSILLSLLATCFWRPAGDLEIE